MSDLINCSLNNKINSNILSNQSKNYKQLINAPNANYIILPAKKADFTDIYEFMVEDFLLNEPLNQTLNITKAEAKGFFEEIVHASLIDNVSYIVREKLNSNEIGKIVAICLNSIIRRSLPSNNDINENNTAEQKKLITCTDLQSSSKIDLIKNILNLLEDKAWKILAKKYNCLLSVLILSVDKKFTRRGIANQLIAQSIENAKCHKCDGLLTEATAYNSQQLFEKVGFTRLYKISHSNWCFANTNEQIFNCENANNNCVTLEFKPL